MLETFGLRHHLFKIEIETYKTPVNRKSNIQMCNDQIRMDSNLKFNQNDIRLVAILRDPESECRKGHQLKTYGLSSPE
jgi:hypothetical protein